jgi:hypothetical protein
MTAIRIVTSKNKQIITFFFCCRLSNLIFFIRVTGKPPLGKPKDTVDSVNNKESPWIENAAYFLKEHEVFISHIHDCHNVFIRLVGENFSVKYEKLLNEMNSFYKMNKIGLKNFEDNSFCIGNI